MSGAAQRNVLSSNASNSSNLPPAEASVEEPVGSNARSLLKQLAAERLAAHRNRRAAVERREAQVRREQAEAQAAIRLQARRDANRAEVHPDALRVREAVAERYRQSVSYHEFLAAEAQRATAEARARAEVAARNAQAVAAVQRQLLEETQRQLLEETQRRLAEEQERTPSNQPEPRTVPQPGKLFEELPLLQMVETRPDTRPDTRTAVGPAEGPRTHRRTPTEERTKEVAQALAEPGFDFTGTAPAAWVSPAASVSPAARFPSPRLQVRLPEEVELAPPSETFYAPSQTVPEEFPHGAPKRAEELAELDEEIEFRLAPEFSDLVLETQPIPANIIEFPRELVATRKARPRLAEGPLRSAGGNEPQLRIFEVELAEAEPTRISAEPEASALAAAPEWQGLMLEAGPAEEQGSRRISAQLEEQLHLDQPLYVATVTRRAFAAALDLLCLAAGFSAFLTAVLKIGGSGLLALPEPLLGGATVGSFAVFAAIYQVLFFTLNEATPGMRAARLAFCTFSERNPSRRAMRRRLVSTALAACPLGLGLVWMLLDGEGLGWHDRMSRMYPRAY